MKQLISYINESKNFKLTNSERDALSDFIGVICGNIGEWNGNSLSLQLDHINGIHTDNRIENLRMLCPNCHSQTETFSKRKREVSD